MDSRWRRLSAAAGLAAPVVFVGSFLLQPAFRPDYDAMSAFVSELSLGPAGWVQKATFVASGVLVLGFVPAARTALVPGRGRVALPVILGVIGACLAASGVADTDHAVLFAQQSVHGRIHGVLGALVFLGMPVSSFVMATRLRRAGEPAARAWFLGSGIAMIVLTVALKAAELPGSPLQPVAGLLQRLDLVLFMGSLFACALRVLFSGRRTRLSRRGSTP